MKKPGTPGFFYAKLICVFDRIIFINLFLFNAEEYHGTSALESRQHAS